MIIKGQLLFASVTTDGEGISLRLQSPEGKIIECISTIQDDWLKIPPGKNPQKELQKVCDLLNGYERLSDGSILPIKDYKPKIITIVQSGD